MCCNRKKNDLLYDMEKPYRARRYTLESERRDIYYSALVKDIVKYNRCNQIYKFFFFLIVCGAFFYILITCTTVMINISQLKDITYAGMGVALSGFGGILSAVIVLPSIIAKHLFPEDSEKSKYDFIRDNQKFDLENISGSSPDENSEE